MKKMLLICGLLVTANMCFGAKKSLEGSIPSGASVNTYGQPNDLGSQAVSDNDEVAADAVEPKG